MKLSALLLFLTIVIANPVFSQTWGWQMGGSWQDEITAIHVQEDGTVYAVGNFRGQIDIDPGPGVFVIGESLNENQCGFVAHFANDGNLLSANYLCGNNSNVLFKDVSFYNGKVYIGGVFDNGAGPSEDVVEPIVMNSNGEWDTFMLRLNLTLSTIEQHYSWGGAQTDEFGELEFDDQGNIWVSAYTQSAFIDIGGIQPQDFGGPWPGGAGTGYIAKFSSINAADAVTAIYFQAPQVTIPPKFQMLTTTELAVVYNGISALEDGIIAEMYISKISSDGSYLADSTVPLIQSADFIALSAWVEDFTIDSEGSLVILTDLGGLGNFDISGNSLEAETINSASVPRALIRYNSLFSYQWHEAIGSFGQYCFLDQVITDELNNIYITGTFQTELSLGDELLQGNGVNNDDSFLGVFNSNGAFLYADDYGMLGIDQVNDMHIFESGDGLLLYKGGVAGLGGYFSTGIFNSMYGGETDMMLHVEPIDFLPVLGCLDPQACNYNPNANTEDNSCILASDFSILGSENPSQGSMVSYQVQYAGEPQNLANLIFEWSLSNPSIGTIEGADSTNPTVTFSQDIQGVTDLCVEISISGDSSPCAEICLPLEVNATILGCTDLLACNYNPDANTEDGSCILASDFSILGLENPSQGSMVSYQVQYAGEPQNLANLIFEWSLSNSNIGTIEGADSANPVVTFSQDIQGVTDLCVEISVSGNSLPCAEICLPLEVVVSVSEKVSPRIRVYPNPVSNILTLEIPSGKEPAECRIFNSVGSEVMFKRIDSTQSQFEMDFLNAGLYWMIINTGNQQYSFRLIKD